MDVLKNTMKSLLNDINGVNIGLMTLNGINQSLPVSDIDKGQQRRTAIDLINAMQPNGGTPIARALYNAARYFNGFPGKHDSGNALGKNVASPITSHCQPSHFVLLTDGQANGYSNADKNNIENLMGARTCPTTNGDSAGEACSIKLVKWLHDEDQSPLANDMGIQNVFTHTIGFALNALGGAQGQKVRNYLQDLANNGNGLHRTADKADELLDAFKAIIKQATEIKNTSFVNPSPAGGDYQSDEHKKQIYYPMFQPIEHDRWPGNLKRYGLRVNGNNLVEIDNSKPPIDAKDVDGQFKSNARSWWNDDVIDGNDVSKGGAAWKLPAPNERHLWVGFNDYSRAPFPTAQTNGNTIQLTPNNSPIIDKLNNNSEHKELLRYIRGFADDGKTARRALGDPLHSAPTLFSYECKGDFNTTTGKCVESADTENTSQMAIIGTNEGFVQMFDTATGIEQFAFMPEELLKNIKPLYQDSTTGSRAHIYGMDNTVTVWVDNLNANGTFEKKAKKVYAYATMRRGGKSVYALDITDRNNPTLKWKISAGDSGFERLGQTWSQPVKTKINIDGKITDVLIFGGGYDEQQDTPENYRTASQGSDIYIVNAETGEKLWSASNDAKITEMKYSIPGNVRVLSLDSSGKSRADGLATQFFVGDVGGQIWRFFINNGNPLDTLVIGGGTGNNGLLANFGGTPGNHDANARRFYHGADVAAETSGGKSTLFVNIGSGYRAHPLDTKVHDHMYSLHVDLTDNGKTLTEADLSRQTDGKFNGSKTTDEIINGQKSGWLVELQGLGEKIISTPKTISGRLFVNTYMPPRASNDPCAGGKSENSTYGLNLANATPFGAADTVDTGNYSDYAILSKSQGALGDPNVICFEGNCWVQFAPGEFSDPFSRQAGAGRKTYWIDL
ncbi:hypothetical protein AXE65_08585 [Ventosimonas gracilis]|uniref:PilY1 beta-propeller domain-containing protein n=2 Tax=Ventosimonas gracilis TaxID=1680762 RepID=A0A139SYD9_9GAMM|nr:hypothetical protein AXE65_08585 [Ventosimonas gracilis]